MESFPARNTFLASASFCLEQRKNKQGINLLAVVTLRSYYECLSRFCFNVYDLTGKGYVGKEEMTTLLQKCLKLQGQEEEGEDGVKVTIDTLYWNETLMKE